MSYRAPVEDIAFTLRHAAGFAPAQAAGLYGDLGDDVLDAVLAEAGRFAGEVIAPLNSIGDRTGARFEDGAVTTPPGWRDAYRAWAAAGWNGLAAPAQWGGQDLPHARQRRLRRDVECRLHGIRHRAGADHERDRRPRGAWLR